MDLITPISYYDAIIVFRRGSGISARGQAEEEDARGRLPRLGRQVARRPRQRQGQRATGRRGVQVGEALFISIDSLIFCNFKTCGFCGDYLSH